MKPNSSDQLTTSRFADGPAAGNLPSSPAGIIDPITVGAGLTRGPDGNCKEPAGFAQCKLRTLDLSGRLAIFVADHPPFLTSPLHRHRETDEWFYVEKGEFLFEVNGAFHYFVGGESLLIPQMTPHRYITGPNPGRLVVVFSPGGGFEEFMEELTRLRKDPAFHQTHEEAVALYSHYGGFAR